MTHFTSQCAAASQVCCLYEGQSVPLFYFQVQCQVLAGFIVGNFSYFPVSSTLSVVTISHFWQVTTSHWNTLQLNDAWHQEDHGADPSGEMLPLIDFLFVHLRQPSGNILYWQPSWELIPYCFYSASFSVQILQDWNLMFFLKLGIGCWPEY